MRYIHPPLALTGVDTRVRVFVIGQAHYCINWEAMVHLISMACIQADASTTLDTGSHIEH